MRVGVNEEVHVKRLLFSVAGLSAIFMMNGCTTATGAFKSADGKELKTPGGSAIVVTDQPIVTPSKPVVPPNASYLERLQAKKAVAEQEVQISVAAAEQARELYEASRDVVLVRIREAKGMDGLRTVLDFVDGLPLVKPDVLKKIASQGERELVQGADVALQALLLDEVQTCLVSHVYPGLAKGILDGLRPKVEKALSEGQFAYARELIWGASTYSIPELDDRIRADAVEILHGRVNPQNWEALEKKIEAVFKKAMDDRAYERGIAELKKSGTNPLSANMLGTLTRRSRRLRTNCSS